MIRGKPQFASWIEDPDPPDYWGEAELRRISQARARALRQAGRGRKQQGRHADTVRPSAHVRRAAHHDDRHRTGSGQAMILTRLAIVLALLMPGATLAQQTRETFRDASGRVTGWATTNNSGTTYYDSSARNVGRSTTNNTGTTYRDNMGRVTGSVRRK